MGKSRKAFKGVLNHKPAMGENFTKDLELREGSKDVLLGTEKSQKTFRDRADEMMKKTQGQWSHLVERNLSPEDWLYIHKVIRKSKGIKNVVSRLLDPLWVMGGHIPPQFDLAENWSKYMIEALSPYLLHPAHVLGWKCQYCEDMIESPVENYASHGGRAHGRVEECQDHRLQLPCDVCGLYVKHNQYVVHWVPHLMEHECQICKKTFSLNCHLQHHHRIVHEESQQNCAHCGKELKNKLALRRHVQILHSERTNCRICDICGKSVKLRCLEPHKLTHSSERPYKCDFGGCVKTFKTPSTLSQHQKVHETDSKAQKYLCEYCGKRFKHHTSWDLHVYRLHEGAYVHECSVCKKKFHKLFELRKHATKHSDLRPFACQTCGKQFKTKTHLKEHLTIHTRDTDNACPICGKLIRMKANLYKHLKVHRSRGDLGPEVTNNDVLGDFTPSSENSKPQPSSDNSTIDISTATETETQTSDDALDLFQNFLESEQAHEPESLLPEADYVFLDSIQAELNRGGPLVYFQEPADEPVTAVIFADVGGNLIQTQAEDNFISFISDSEAEANLGIVFNGDLEGASGLDYDVGEVLYADVSIS